eukprot:1160729-Pelagomonas_calceolata.AAC.23
MAADEENKKESRDAAYAATLDQLATLKLTNHESSYGWKLSGWAMAKSRICVLPALQDHAHGPAVPVVGGTPKHKNSSKD